MDDRFPELRYYHSGGLTKRELFAAMSMQGYCSGVFGMQDAAVVAHLAAQQADALLEELNKDDPQIRFVK